MRDFFICDSSAGNNYLVSKSKPQILLIHPILNYLIKKFVQGIDIDSWLKSLEKKEINIEDSIKAAKDELLYILSIPFAVKRQWLF
jgi:hypothetical protein